MCSSCEQDCRAANLIAPPGEQAASNYICPIIRLKHNEKPFDVS